MSAGGGLTVQPDLLQPLQPCDVRKAIHAPGTSSKVYGSDQTGTVTYDFNAMGFRGEDYDPDAAFRLWIFGESHAFGTGLPYEFSFGHLLKTHIAAALGLDPAKVNCLNFSVGGASADYCVRALYRQPVARRADLVIMNFPTLDRMEYFDGKVPLFFNLSAMDEQELEKAPEPLIGFYELYTTQLGQINYVKNILLAQSLLRQYGVDHLNVVQHLPRGEADFAPDFLPAIDESRIYRHRLFRERKDYAADANHAGPRSHAALAIDLLGAYGKMLVAKGKPDRAARINAFASDLRRTSTDWAFCHPGVIHAAKPGAAAVTAERARSRLRKLKRRIVSWIRRQATRLRR